SAFIWAINREVIAPGEGLVPTVRSLTPCSPPSRRGLATADSAADAPRRPALTAARGLATADSAADAPRRPALTAAARGVPAAARVGTKKRAPRSNKETGLATG